MAKKNEDLNMKEGERIFMSIFPYPRVHRSRFPSNSSRHSDRTQLDLERNSEHPLANFDTLLNLFGDQALGTLPQYMQSEKGFSLIETLAALAILGIVAVGFLSGLATAARATFITDERTTAASLAKSQMEYVKNQNYDNINNPPQYDLLSDLPSSFSVTVTASRLDPEGDGPDDDDGIQNIVVTVMRGSRTITTLEDYKVDRWYFTS